MQYSGETNTQDLTTLADKLCKSNSTAFPIAEKTLYANEGQRKIWAWIYEAYGGWQYDDRNLTDLPEATTTLTLGQQQYTFPTDSAAIMGVEFKNASGTWNKIYPITLEQIQDQGAETEFYKTSGQPIYYRLIANGIKLYPAPDFTQASSLKIFISRDVSTFSVTDTIKTPGFDTEFHEAIATYMALRYSKSNGLEIRNDLQRDWDGNEDVTGREGGWKKSIKKHYSMRFHQLFPPRFITRDSLRDYI